MSCIDHGRKGNALGYSTTSYDGAGVGLHRVVYMRLRGLTRTDIAGFVVRHTCDNPRCINPWHLILGTQLQNVHDSIDRGRHARGSRMGSAKLTEEIVLSIRAEYVPYCTTHGTAAIARRLGVNQSTVSEAIRGVTYGDNHG